MTLFYCIYAMDDIVADGEVFLRYGPTHGHEDADKTGFVCHCGLDVATRHDKQLDLQRGKTLAEFARAPSAAALLKASLATYFESPQAADRLARQDLAGMCPCALRHGMCSLAYFCAVCICSV
jgi:hypothetical protein